MACCQQRLVWGSQEKDPVERASLFTLLQKRSWFFLPKSKDQSVLSPWRRSVGLPEVEKGDSCTQETVEAWAAAPADSWAFITWNEKEDSPALPWASRPCPRCGSCSLLPEWDGEGPSLRGDPAQLESEFLPLCHPQKVFFGPGFLNWS